MDEAEAVRQAGKGGGGVDGGVWCELWCDAMGGGQGHVCVAAVVRAWDSEGGERFGGRVGVDVEAFDGGRCGPVRGARAEDGERAGRER